MWTGSGTGSIGQCLHAPARRSGARWGPSPARPRWTRDDYKNKTNLNRFDGAHRCEGPRDAAALPVRLCGPPQA